MSGNIIVAYGESFQGRLNPSSLEILTPLYKIAKELNKKLVLLILTEEKLEKIKEKEEIKKALCDEVWVVSSPNFSGFKDDLFSSALVEIVRTYQPYGLFFPATLQGMALAPRVAGTLEIGLCSHVHDLKVEEGKIVMVRPTYGDNIIAELYSKSLPVIATLSLNAFPILESQKEPLIKEIFLSSHFQEKSIIKIRKFIPLKKEPSKLTTAKVVLACGQGIKNKETLEKVKKLAQILQGEVGVTRPLCYAGWAEEEQMIGVSGVTVRPKLYIGFGISGALQHTVGMENSEFIIAVNIDKSSPLVKLAHLALIGDAEVILSALLKNLEPAKT